MVEVGQTFGRLTVIGTAPTAKQYRHYRCRCVCGNELTVRGTHLSYGNTKSCGCARREALAKNVASVTHGATRDGKRTPTFSSWVSIWQRVRATSGHHFKYYGGRGITVCDRWQKFENFLADMGPRPSPKHSIDRENNDGNYEPGNCRWATRSQQTRNQRPRKNKCGFHGVGWNGRCYQASISVDGRREHLGNFPSAEDAGNAYQEKRRQLEAEAG